METRDFIKKWQATDLTEIASVQSHFDDLCDLLEVEKPADEDPKGEWYCFEKTTAKAAGGRGRADVWRKRHFAWEYKKKGGDLKAAYNQLLQYVDGLGNPPLLIVSDIERIIIYTHWTNTVRATHEIRLQNLIDPEPRQLLKWCFTRPEQLRPEVTREQLTEQTAQSFAELAEELCRHYDPQQVAHFANRLLFCMFAQHIDLLPNRLLHNLLDTAAKTPARFQEMARNLFAQMRGPGGIYGSDSIEYFNGGLFDDDTALPLEGEDILRLREVVNLDWGAIEPSIFGTLFERGLDPAKRAQLGAHYTDAASIKRIIDPVVINPLRREWRACLQQIRKYLRAPKPEQPQQAEQSQQPQQQPEQSKQQPRRFKPNFAKAQRLYDDFIDRLQNYRVLDPACGSGNFLYLALKGLKDLELEIYNDVHYEGLEKQFPQVDPSVVLGIETEPYAAELARVTIWIGQIQWMRDHGFSLDRNPILKPLQQIDQRDALLTYKNSTNSTDNQDGTDSKNSTVGKADTNNTAAEAPWPAVDAIVGNPPFLGNKRMLFTLGEDYTRTLQQTYVGRVPQKADLVTYWFEKARAHIAEGKAQRAGLVATNSIRKGASRQVLHRLRQDATIFEAWSDQKWTVAGSNVRVSLVCFATPDDPAVQHKRLDDASVPTIYTDLTADIDLTAAQPLRQNLRVCFEGLHKSGPFDIPGTLARRWLQLPSNPNGRPNSDVVKPRLNAAGLAGRPADSWIIDFGPDRPLAEAALYEAPFEHVKNRVKPVRERVRDKKQRENWWLHGGPGSGIRSGLADLARYIVTPQVAKHRLFVKIPVAILPDSTICAITREDDTTFGILHSRCHELWSLRLGTTLEDRPRYTSTNTFRTFPFPAGLTPDRPAAAYAEDARAVAIAEAAAELQRVREHWLNPPELIKREPEVVPGFPDRLLPVDDKATQELKQRTLTNLYNERPTWLQQAHQALDEAVAAAYDWPPDLADEEILTRLLKLNQERKAQESRAQEDKAAATQNGRAGKAKAGKAKAGESTLRKGRAHTDRAGKTTARKG